MAVVGPKENLREALAHLLPEANAVGQYAGGGNPIANVRENMTVIAASRASEVAQEEGMHGAFTMALLDALEGGAADHCGNVTTPALYDYASRRFVGWDQRPIYKANTTEVFTIRQCEPLIARGKLRQLVELFPSADHRFELDPEYEPEDDLGNVVGSPNAEKVARAQLFKAFRDAGLLRTTNPLSQLYWAARRSETVELTPRGHEYWWLVANKKI